MAQSQPFIWHSLNMFRKLVCALPHEKAVALGGALGSLVARFSVSKVSEAQERCAKILGVPRERAREIVLGSYNHFGRAAAEFARMPVMAAVTIRLFLKAEWKCVITASRSSGGITIPSSEATPPGIPASR